jgi:Heterokaryon incompatibility protein (HET)
VLYTNGVLESPAGISGGVSTRKPLETSCSPEAFELLKRWLSGCAEEHDDCKKTISGEEIGSEASTLPTRVIDISPSDRPETPRLVQTKGSMTGRWVALSHCWGDPEHRPITTIKASLHERLMGIPLESMPKTFVDVVTITKMIGLRYLWIDSLCIIQDDDEDWKKESKTMGRYYERAHLTIAASHAYDSRFGCFYKRTYHANLTQAVRLPFFLPTITGTGTAISMLDAGSISVNIAWSQFSTVSPESCTLGDRGWITQEWILSRRMVHYLEEGMAWVCKTTAQDEFGEKLILGDRAKSWSEIVMAHSERSFTYERDMLISLEGLAQETKKSREDKRYLFGLWWVDLPLGLLWKSHDFSFLQRNLSLPDVPSWSWASRKGSIIFQISRPGSAWGGPPFPKVSNFCQIKNNIEENGLWIVSRLKGLDDIFVRRPRDEEVVDASEETRSILQRLGTETLLTVSGEEIGNALFDEGVYCDSPHLQKPTFFSPLVKSIGDEDGKSWCEGLLLQYSTQVMDSFERVGVAQVTEMAWLNGVAEQLVCIV